MLVTLQSGLVQFLYATPITVEVSITRGIKYFIVGLADTALKESKQRIYTAIKNTQFHWPGQRITINLAPTTTRKFGTLLELPIALGVLAASGSRELCRGEYRCAQNNPNEYFFIHSY